MESALNFSFSRVVNPTRNCKKYKNKNFKWKKQYYCLQVCGCGVAIQQDEKEIQEQTWITHDKWYVDRIQENEIVEIAELQAECFHEPPKLQIFEEISYKTFKAEVLDVMRRKFECIREGDYTILIAHEKENNQPVGVIELDIRNERELLLKLNSMDASFGTNKYAYVCSMAVKPDMRRKGVARSLLTAVEQIAGKWGHAILVLQVFEDNESAAKLYTSSGYKLLNKEVGLIGWLRGRRKLTMYKLQRQPTELQSTDKLQIHMDKREEQPQQRMQ